MPAKRGDSDIATAHRRYDVAVVGGGVVGLAVAWRARARGLSRRRARPRRARRRHVARRRRDARAGRRGRRRRARAAARSGCASARRWPAFAAELADVSGIDVGYRALRHAACVARDRDEAEALERELALRERFGLRVERAAAQRGAPRSSPRSRRRVRLALDVPDDHAVDPRLRRAPRSRARPSAPAPCCAPASRSPTVRRAPASSSRRRRRRAGASWSPPAPGRRARPSARVPCPVKGQIAAPARPRAAPACSSASCAGQPAATSCRAATAATSLGATMEERGFDTAVTAGGVHELLRDAAELVPGVLELEVEERVAGLRPGTPDNAPLIGRRARPTASSGRPATTATASCWRRSPPTSSPPRSPARRPSTAFAPPLRASRGVGGVIVRQRRAARARRRDDRRAARRPRRRAARPRRRRRRRRRGRPARRVGRRAASPTGDRVEALSAMQGG